MNPDNVHGEKGRDQPSAGDAAPGSAENAPPAEAAGRPAAVDVQAYIGRQLRAVYDDVARQPIPDRFLALMKQLEGRTPEG